MEFQAPHLKISWNKAGTPAVEKPGLFTQYKTNGKTLLFRGEVFSIPDGRKTIGPPDQNTDELGDRLLKYIESGRSWNDINGQFSAVLIRNNSVAAYRSAFSLHLLYFSAMGISDRLVALSDSNPKYSFEYLQKFILDSPSLQFSSPLTPIEGIERLYPEALLEIRGGKPLQTLLPFKTYHAVESETLTREEMAMRLREKLKEVMLWYLAKGKPFHAELSGGLDSSFVCSYLSDLSKSSFSAHMFSYRKHPSHEFSENCAKKVAKEKGIDLTIVDSEEVKRLDLATAELPYQDEPSDTYWLGALFGPIMQKRIKENSLLFSGFACDQLFMRGHEILQCLFVRRDFRNLWRVLKDMAKSVERSTVNFLFQFLLSIIPRKILARFLDYTRNWKLNPLKIDELVPQIRRFMRVEWLKSPPGKNPAVWLCEVEDEGERLERRFFDKDIPHSNLSYLFAPWLVLGPYIEPNNIEYVHPFCDIRLMDFAYREVPWQYIHDYKNPYKQLLREAQKGIVPEDIRLRPHNDFSFDGYYYSLLSANRNFLYGLLMDATKEFSSWINAKEAVISFEKMMLGSYGNSELKLARLLSYLIWRKNFSRLLA